MKVLLKIALTLAVFIGGIVGVVLWMTSGLADAAEAFMTAFAEGRYEDALSHTTPGFRDATDTDELHEFRTALALEGFDQVGFNGRSASGDLGTVQGLISHADAEARPFELVLIRTDEEWRVQAVATFPRGVVAAVRPG